MPSDQYFSSTYQQARTKFVAAGHGAKARVSDYVIPERKGSGWVGAGCGVAEIRRSEQPDLVVIISETHGDDSWWKAAVYGRSVDMILRAGRGLSSP